MKKNVLVTLGIIFAFVLSACSSNSTAGNRESAPTINAKSAPNFMLKDVHGNSHSLKDYSGKKRCM
ncbi:hypothetical protein J6TS7_01040 [Paenibacillus dendritiformis]|uniref:hypothetical protein n=1 Tax=Paenibacillus TaxID=44249 RepID=UPI001B29DBB8|nr:hypothetical protein [Paenibacillus dendritiformis]GIO76494.1 hypothetical protein J6TS7_01040 [Paenibacillus dendritiformis]